MIPKDNLSLFYPQSRPGLCGIAAVRNILSIQFEVEASEKELLKMLYGYYFKKYQVDGERWFEKNGTSPSALAFLLRQKLSFPIKILCSRKGNISLLEYFRNELKALPIIHCQVFYPEIGMTKPEGHYMMYGRMYVHSIIKSKSSRLHSLADKIKLDCGLLNVATQQVVSYGERQPSVSLSRISKMLCTYGRMDNKSKKISLFNPSVGRGWEFYSEKEFLKKWETKGEKWWLVVLAEEVKLDAERCKGKYL